MRAREAQRQQPPRLARALARGQASGSACRAAPVAERWHRSVHARGRLRPAGLGVVALPAVRARMEHLPAKPLAWPRMPALRPPANRGRGSPQRQPRPRPALALELHPTLNGVLDPLVLAAYSNRELWWLCPACGNQCRQAPYARRAAGSCSRLSQEMTHRRRPRWASPCPCRSPTRMTKDCGFRISYQRAEAIRQGWRACVAGPQQHRFSALSTLSLPHPRPLAGHAVGG